MSCTAQDRARIRAVKEAFAEVLETKRPVWEVINREPVGWIGVVYGDARNGLRHILARRDDQHRKTNGQAPDGMTVLDAIAETLVLGVVTMRPEPSTRADVRRGEWHAVLERKREGRAQAWVFTAFKKSASGASSKGEPRGEAMRPGCSGVSTMAGSGGHGKDTAEDLDRKPAPKVVGPPSDHFNPAPAFGSAERRRAMKGIKKVSGKSGARAQKRRERGAKRKAQEHAEEVYHRLSEKQAAGGKLTKTQAAALKRHEAAAMRAAGVQGDSDAEVLAEVERLQKEHRKEEQAYRRAVARILGPTGEAAAVKIARADGKAIDREEAEGLRAAGWMLYPAGTAPALVGRSLPGVALNPTEGLEAALGKIGEARAVVLAALHITERTLNALRAAGYDVSPAPKALREGLETKANPTASGAVQRKVYEALRKRPGTAEELARKVKATPEEVEGALDRLRGMGLAHPTRSSLFGVEWAPGAPARGLFDLAPAPPAPVQPALAFNGTKKAGQRRSRRSTSPEKPANPEGMTKTRRHAAHAGPAAPVVGTDLAKVYKAWTGRKPLEVITFKFEPRKGDAHGLPSQVVILGRVSMLVEASGKVLEFGLDKGPFMVTDAKASRVWLLDGQKEHNFNLKPSVIAYITTKPKFGDKGPVEYVHGFSGPAKACMTGMVGTLTGGFRVTPRGIEG